MIEHYSVLFLLIVATIVKYNEKMAKYRKKMHNPKYFTLIPKPEEIVIKEKEKKNAF